MKILLTGATGFVGSHLITALKKEHEVHILVRPSSTYNHLGIKKVFVFNNNIEELSLYLLKNKIEGIVHLASLYIAQHKAEQIKDMIYSNIYLGTALLEAATKGNVRWFLNTGTIWQNYNSSHHEYHPVNLYAASKEAFIKMAAYYIESTTLKFCTLKLCDTYGPNDTRRKLFSLFKDYADKGSILEMSPGEQKLDILHIDDVIDGFKTLIKHLSSEKELEASYVLSSGYQYSLKELANLFSDFYGKPLQIHFGGMPYRKREVMLPYKGNILPDWEAKINLEEGIKKTFL